MVWLLRHFWHTVTAVGGLLGLMYFGLDWEGRAEALAWWERTFPMLNLRTLLIAVYAMAVLWILHLELQRAMNGKAWVPVRAKAQKWLGFAFSKDKRSAEFRRLVSDHEVRTFARALRAKLLAEGVAALEPLDQCPLPIEGLSDPDPRAHHCAVSRIIDRSGDALMKAITTLAEMGLDDGDFQRDILNAGNKPELWEQMRVSDEEIDWPPELRGKWYVVRARIDRYNELLPDIKRNARAASEAWKNVRLDQIFMDEILRPAGSEPRLSGSDNL